MVSECIQIMEFCGNIGDEKKQVIQSNNEETEEFKLGKEQVRLWMRDIVNLPQYFDVFMNEGYYELKYFRGLSQEDLDGLCIKLGHKKKIVRYAKFLNNC